MKAWIMCMLLGTVLAVRAGLVAHYPLDENFEDAAGGNHLAKAARASIDTQTKASGRGSLRLEPGKSPDSAEWKALQSQQPLRWATDTRTVALWVKADTNVVMKTNATMVAMGRLPGGTPAKGSRFDLRLDRRHFRVEVEGGAIITQLVIADGQWHHVAVVVPSDPCKLDKVRLYVDGRAAELMLPAGPQKGPAKTEMDTAEAPILVGAGSKTDATRIFVGWIDDLRVYDEALDDEAIRNLTFVQEF